MADPRRWISRGCPKGLDEIANIYVKSEEFNDRMEREVRDWLPTFSCTDDGIVGRMRGAECDAALEAPRDMDGVDEDGLPTQRRGFDSENEMLLLGGNLSEERVSPQTPFPKTFCDVSVGTVTSAVGEGPLLDATRAGILHNNA